ncbi:MAG: hypothetical protein D6711_06375 [Chloroflexi bacterium]|nr:MAG: hypothetical protein D6711_06375 [Chloroflexota bacterium]
MAFETPHYQVTSQRLKAIIQLMRLRQHVPFVLPLTLLGALMAVYLNDVELDWRLALIVLANILGMSCAFIINDIEDSDDDAQDKHKRQQNAISSGLITKHAARIAFNTLAALTLGLYALAGMWTFILGGSGLILAYLYSVHPYRFKARPGVDLLSHALGGGSLQVLISYFLYDHSPNQAWYLIAGMTTASLYGQFYNQIQDYDHDRKTGLKNTTILIGKSTATTFMYASIGITILCIWHSIRLGIFPHWLVIVIFAGGIACSLFVWQTDMRGKPVGFLEAFQVPVLLVLNFTVLLWLSWEVGLLTL